MKNPAAGHRSRSALAIMVASWIAGCALVVAAFAATPVTPPGSTRLPKLVTGVDQRIVHFVPNSFAFWDDPRRATTLLPPVCTTESCAPLPCTGPDCVPVPAYANVLLKPANFLPCEGGPFALCYYSGPEPTSGGADLTCTLTPDGRFANCNCYEIPYGTYFVDINAILNYGVYRETVEACGDDGRLCRTPNSAPVCKAINDDRLIPKADLISTFSFDCLPTDGLGSTDCSTTPSLYAGCMTAPCWRTGTEGIVQCSCPTYDGPFEIGLNDQSCTLDGPHVWSAAFTPVALPYPQPETCFPDAPGPEGCPLLPRDEAQWPTFEANCDLVCEFYSTCRGQDGVQQGFTCDATACTDSCNDRDLLGPACGAITSCSGGAAFDAAAKLEIEARCSCCASQLCGCDPDAKTEAAIGALVREQRSRSVVTQCDLNGTLCGDAN